MSKISEIIARVDAYKPNGFSEEVKLKWLNDLDGKIGLDVFLMDITEIRARQIAYPEGLETEPLVTFPHEDIYDLYLAAKIDYENGEYNRYQNTMAAYNEAYGNFVRWLARTYQPAQGYIRGGCSCRSNPPYYITAYGLACQMGYQGTLEQWVESLPGKDGISPVLAIGEVTALPAGSRPTAKLTGTAENPVLELGIPAAPTGATSEKESAEHPGCWYRTVGGETEWLNPPMVAGVEYRTTERHDGVPVYIKRLVEVVADKTIREGEGIYIPAYPIDADVIDFRAIMVGETNGGDKDAYLLPLINQNSELKIAVFATNTRALLFPDLYTEGEVYLQFPADNHIVNQKFVITIRYTKP